MQRKCARCLQVRVHYAKGLCKSCYAYKDEIDFSTLKVFDPIPDPDGRKRKSKYLYEREAERLKQGADRKSKEKVARALEKAAKMREATKTAEKVKRQEVSRRLKGARSAAEKLALRAEKASVELEQMKIYTEINESLVDVIADHIIAGLSVRGACRLAHVSYAKVQRWLVEAKGANPSPVIAYLDARVEDALGQNEAAWVELVKDGAETRAIEVEDGQFVKKGDGKLAVAMLERQHSDRYSPRQIQTIEDPKPEIDLSDMSDEELATFRAYEAMMEARAKKAVAAGQVLSLPPGTATQAPIEAEGESILLDSDAPG